MRHVRMQGLLLIALVIGVLGCGGNQDAGDVQTPAASASSGGATASMTLPANLDQGPRAGESKVDETKAKAGEALFKDKGCSACHAFGQRVTGPDLAGVSMRRTQTWLEYQILHPDVMVKQDPIAPADVRPVRVADAEAVVHARGGARRHRALQAHGSRVWQRP